MGNNPGPINGPRNRGYRECFDQRRLLEGGGNTHGKNEENSSRPTAKASEARVAEGLNS